MAWDELVIDHGLKFISSYALDELDGSVPKILNFQASGDFSYSIFGDLNSS